MGELRAASRRLDAGANYRDKIAVFLRWWCLRGYEAGIPDEADAALETARRVPSWRRICKALLRNDYWCKGLSFSQPASPEGAHARYQAIMRKRREAWGIDRFGRPRGWTETGPGVAWEGLCGADAPGRPTAKQLGMVAALTGGSTPEHAWRALGQVLDMPARTARRKASREDAAQAIEELLAMNAKERHEKFGRKRP